MPTADPVSGTVTAYAGDLALGTATLDGTGHAVIDADTSNLPLGTYTLTVGYAGNDVFGKASIDVPLTVEGSAGSTTIAPSTQEPTSPATTTTVTELASTGFPAESFLTAALTLLGAGLLLVAGVRRRPYRRH